MTISPKNDILNRQSEKVVSSGGSNILGEYYYYSKYGDHATNRISAVRYGNKVGANYAITDGLKYSYDSVGNITKVYENGQLQASYSYDKLNRIAREDNKNLNKTYMFSYDNKGNILSKLESNYTTKPLDEIETLTSKNYSYGDNSDRLLSYNGETFEYDAIGNPRIYRSKAVTWAKDTLQLDNGAQVSINYLRNETLAQEVTIYNFEIEDNHAYYVSESNISFSKDWRINKRRRFLKIVVKILENTCEIIF